MSRNLAVVGSPSGARGASLYGRTLMTEAEYAKSEGGLMLDNGERITVTSSPLEIRIGCVTVSWGAWEMLKKLIEGR